MKTGSFKPLPDHNLVGGTIVQGDPIRGE
jgi:hypothetical protein